MSDDERGVIRREIAIRLTVDDLAAAFWSLDDDQQARFFVAVERAAASSGAGSFERQRQWYAVGSHIRSCQCSTDEARAMVRDIAWAAEHGAHE